ncbi:DUF5691 domain-containing protein [Acetobacter cibinongensis]|uniref:Uncharacterized protein n=1 Tax=Acetobacter cibinongensis TaxID=146475 RepID=A0A1Z5YWG1_9PROT|nr:DUF5691 domain-containing protein [Acetobacter cibinongensis]OUJ03380.1 hypothetical protein HK14_02110 [Acetobacter cibinongensis]
MVEAVYDMMGPILARWAMGTPAASVAKAWQPLFATDQTKAELQLLALSGQFLNAMVAPSAPNTLRTLPLLPRLTVPQVPAALRPLVQRLLPTLKDTAQQIALVRLLASYGYSLNPSDWMPQVDADVPSFYAPWQDWLATVAAGQDTLPDVPNAPLNVENWHAFGAASRVVAFARLRQQDPAATHALLDSHFSHLLAGERLKILQTFGPETGPADIPFLQHVALKDRAEAVRQYAQRLLTRTATGTDEKTKESAAELADFFTLTPKSPASTQLVLQLKPTKTTAQASRRNGLCLTVPFQDFAAALTLSPDMLPGMWPWCVDKHLDHCFSQMAASSASDAVIARLAHAAVASGSCHLIYKDLNDRLPPSARRDLANSLLAADEQLWNTLTVLKGVTPLDDVVDTSAFRAIITTRTEEASLSPTVLAQELLALGLMTTPKAATHALAALEQAGFLAADSRLDMLRLTIALEKTGLQE